MLYGRVSFSQRIVKVDADVGKGLQREQRLSEAETTRCFQVVLEGKVVALMAPDVAAKKSWVVGLGAIAGGLHPPRSEQV